MNVNFFLKEPTKEKTSIQAIIRYKGNRFKLTTGISVEVKFWDKTAHRAKQTTEYPDYEVINIQLEDWELRAKKVFLDAAKDRKIPTIDDVKEAVKIDKPTDKQPADEFLAYFRNYYTTHEYKEGAIKNYQKTERFLKAYENQFRIKLTFDDINIEFYKSFKKWFMSLHKPQSKKDREQNKKPEFYSLNYFGVQIKQIKTMMRESGREGDGLHDNLDYKNRRFVKEQEEADTIYLTTAEIKTIEQLHITPELVRTLAPTATENRIAAKTEALRKTQNYFLIGCYTALRISDFSRLGKWNISDKYIRIKPRKGTRKNDDVVIPIHPVIRRILESGFNFSNKMSDQKFNEHLKELCKLAKITEPITTVRTEGGRQVSRTVEKWQLVASHTCRRSGATNMYLAGIPSISIMKITGHKTEKSFLKYIRISQEENAMLLAEHPFFKS